ncbi:DNA polymerase I [Virgibacillus dakarensis]|uniref:DNA polymerase I n=1 Tax=Lentibacillus populi TaxID=1827502 RepID=A0A9W5TU80_9BACI|nr:MULTISPECIES: DNA polymerase I [Bacillaceae]MBT2216555.1 DNA polymerase I [Virgibacillus dakarensis]MTW84277.1 DNA polymerase I [Virgibacillus dakarensis]GGB27677.1 DNA polymerase [Lentibacillus populi]
MSKKLVLIDGNSIIYRAFFALPLLNNDKGVYTNAVYGFTTMLLKILEDEKPTHMLVAFDAGKTTFRHQTYQEYKGGRQKTPPELSEQFPVLKELLDAFHIPHYQLDQYEADDIIGTLSKKGNEENWDVTVISGDKDLLQLVSDNVTVNLTKKGISDVDSYTPAFMMEKMEINPEQIIDLKALMGDSSDNVPGVPGVGQKTATKLIKQYKTIEEVYAHIDEISGKKLKENLANHKKDAFMSKELVTINCDSPIEVTVHDITYDGYEQSKVSAIFKDLGFQSLLNKLAGESDEAAETAELSAIDYSIVNEINPDMFTGNEAIVVEMLSDNYHQAPIEGIGIVNEENNYFIPTDIAVQSEIFKEWAEDSLKKKYVFDAKKTLVALLNHDIKVNGIVFDMLLASYLLNPAENHHDIPAIGHRMGHTAILFDEEVYGKGAKIKVPEQEKVANHVVRKTSLLFQVKEKMEDELKQNEQYELLKELEMPLALILGEMEHTGVQVDIRRLEDMGAELKQRLAEIENEVYTLAGETFNLNSPKQLGPVLFEKLGLPVIKKTKTGYSTAADVLEQLRDEHEIIPKLLLYRQLGKLQSTYVEGLLKVVDQDTHKIHTRFNQALTQTGRLSSIDPNLQNIPIRLEEGRKIRQAFVPAKEDWIMFAADYSQIELRVLAHIAKDDKLIDAFQHDTDIHTQTAMEVFHTGKDVITANMRRHAKAVNFGIVYGISDYGLSQSLGITRKEAQQFIDRYLESYPGVKNYMEEIVQDAKHKGFVTTLMNRRRYLPDITSRNFNKRSFAERTAMNTPIQGSAADIIKKAMIDLHQTLIDENLEARMLLQVHDELILEAPKEEVEKLKEIVPATMEHTVELDVPLRVEYQYGKSWFDAK